MLRTTEAPTDTDYNPHGGYDLATVASRSFNVHAGTGTPSWPKLASTWRCSASARLVAMVRTCCMLAHVRFVCAVARVRFVHPTYTQPGRFGSQAARKLHDIDPLAPGPGDHEAYDPYRPCVSESQRSQRSRPSGPFASTSLRDTAVTTWGLASGLGRFERS